MGKDNSKRKEEERHVDIQQSLVMSVGESSHGMGSYDSKLEISYDKQETELLSFKQWHRRMQTDHDIKHAASTPTFSVWHWCNCLCAPCRYFDAIDYNKKLCRNFLRFRTFKTWTTGFIIGAFVYVIVYQLLGKDILPGGTYFYLLVMFFTAFLVGNILLAYGVPGTVGQMVVGIIFANLPFHVEESKSALVMEYSEKFMLLIIIIKAALLVDFGHLYQNVQTVAELTFLPYIFEFGVILICGHYLMKLPWIWSALQGVLVAPVSLASTLSILDKARKSVLSEHSKIPTIIIAASSIQIIITIYVYSLLLAVIFSKGLPWTSTWWSLLLAILIQVIGAAALGVLLGCLAGMFPDRRSFGAPYFRILFVGTGTTALVMGFHKLGISGVGVLSSSTMVVIASNIWEELGWHESSNPVLYFYSALYFFAQPVGISLVGFSMKFDSMDPKDIGISIGIVALGSIVRELLCIAVLYRQKLKTTKMEKIFITICWLPKGAAEALLAAIMSELVRENYVYVSNSKYTLEELLEYVKIVLETTIFGMLITAPISSLLNTFFIPTLGKT